MSDTRHYDVIIIGAGIQGAGVAQAATTAGYSTLIIEKHPAAGMGTSCKSSKLIHGGLRYLESGQLKVVRQCLYERKILLQNAPHLVKLIPFYIPIYTHSCRPAWLVFLGLCIYSLFSFKPFSIIKKKQWASLDGLELNNLKTVFKYYDAQTDDKKLTQAVIQSAIKYGATIHYNATFIQSTKHQKQHHLVYEENKIQHNVSCDCIINCSGPWVKSTHDRMDTDFNIPNIALVAGTHIIVKHKLYNGIYYIEADDKRAIFVMPWKDGTTLIGTTEKTFTGKPNDITATDEEINYLLKTYNQHFNQPLSHHDIIESFAGLRVLPVSDASIFNQSRESLILHNTTLPATITLIGGKLTAYRASSAEVLKKLKVILPPISKTNITATIETKNIPL